MYFPVDIVFAFCMNTLQDTVQLDGYTVRVFCSVVKDTVPSACIANFLGLSEMFS